MDDWKCFELALNSRGRTFQSVQDTSNRSAVIAAVGITDVLSVAAIETEWNRKVGSINQQQSQQQQRYSAGPIATTHTSPPPPQSAAIQSIYTADAFNSVPSEIQESVLVEEIYSALCGVEGSFLQAHVVDGKEVFTVTHELDPAAAAQVTPVLPCCAAHMYVQRRCMWLQLESPSPVAQALGDGVQQLLDVYYARVGEILVDARTATTQRVLGLVVTESVRVSQPIVFTETILRDVADKTGGALLQALHVRLCRHTGNADCEEVLKFLLKHAVRPFFSILKEWLTNGTISHLHDDFMVVEDRTMGRNLTLRKWEEGFTLRTAHCPAFLQRHSRVILATGKYIQLLNGSGAKYDVAPPDFSTTDFDPNNLTPITDAVTRAHDSTSQRVLQLLFKDHSLVEKYASLRRYWLVSTGDWLANFLDTSWDLLHLAKTSVKVHTLTTMLRTSIAKSASGGVDVAFYESLSVVWARESLTNVIAEMSTSSAPTPSERRSSAELIAANYIQFEIQPPWPLALMLNSGLMCKHNIVFRYIFWCRIIERKLQNAWFKGPLSKLNSRDLHLAFALRKQMMHTLRQVMMYTHAVVLDPLWSVFVREAQDANSVDSVLAAHDKFIDTVMERLLLRSSRFKILVRLLVTIEIFADLGTRFSSNLDTIPDPEMTLNVIQQMVPNVRDSESRFLKCLGELSCAKGTELVLLQPLLSCLDFSKYYERLAVFAPTAGPEVGPLGM